MGRPQPKKKSDYSRRTGVVTAVSSAVFCCRSCLSSPPTQTRTYQSTNFPVDYSSLFFLLLPLRLETSATSNKLRPNGNAIEAKSGKLLCLAYTRDGKRRRVGYWGFTKDFPDRSIAIQRLACASIRLLEKKINLLALLCNLLTPHIHRSLFAEAAQLLLTSQGIDVIDMADVAPRLLFLSSFSTSIPKVYRFSLLLLL